MGKSDLADTREAAVMNIHTIKYRQNKTDEGINPSNPATIVKCKANGPTVLNRTGNTLIGKLITFTIIEIASQIINDNPILSTNENNNRPTIIQSSLPKKMFFEAKGNTAYN